MLYGSPWCAGSAPEDASSIVKLLNLDAVLATRQQLEITYMKNATVRAACAFDTEARASQWVSIISSDTGLRSVREEGL
jgi:hypothetical protein